MTVKRYILEQQAKDVFEYNVYRDPTGQSKIGKFAQTKLLNFGGACYNGFNKLFRRKF